MKVLRNNEVIQLEDGDWVKLPKNFMYQRCCDCGLIHHWEFEQTETGIMLCATRVDDDEALRVESEWKLQTSQGS